MALYRILCRSRGVVETFVLLAMLPTALQLRSEFRHGSHSGVRMTKHVEKNTVVFHVSESKGDDNWSGRARMAYPKVDWDALWQEGVIYPEQHGPFKTVERAQKAVRDYLGKWRNRTLGSLEATDSDNAPKVKVYVDKGDYVLQKPLVFGLPDSGLNKYHRVEWSGYPEENESPRINGGVRITGWTRAAHDPIWEAKVNTDIPFGQLFVNGVRRTRARHPNLGNYLIWKSPLCKLPPRPKTDNCSHAARYGFIYSEGDVPDPAKLQRLQDIEVVVYHGWTASRHHLLSITPANHTILFKNPADRPIGFWPNHDSEGGGRYYLDNMAEALDEPGEWYYDQPTSQISYWPLPGEDDPNKLEIIAPQLNEVLKINGAKHISYNNLAFQFSRYLCNETEVCDHQSTAWQTTGGVHITNSTDVTFTNVEISQHGPYAVWVDSGSADIHISSSNIHELGSGGVRIGSAKASPDSQETLPRNIMVFNCTIQNGGWVFPSGTGILIQYAYNSNISHNDVSNFCYAGISVGWTWTFAPSYCGGHYIGHNHVFNLGMGVQRQLGDAMACIYTLGWNNDTRIMNNLCHDVYAFYTGGYGVSHDQGSSGILIENNVVLRTSASPHNQHYGSYNIFKNNMFLLGYHKSWTTRNPGGIRTSPQVTLPNSLTILNNIVLIDNTTALLFDGNWNGSVPNWSYKFDSNVYWSTIQDLTGMSVFGGCSARSCGTRAFNFTLPEWQKQGYDQHSLIADPGFADSNWHSSFNVTLKDDSPALRLGFKQIDTSQAGILKNINGLH